MDTTNKLNPAWVWAFALAAAALAVSSSFVTSGMNWKIGSAIYFGIFAVSGFAAIYLTDARTGIGVVAFLLAALATAIFYYLIIAHAVDTMTGAMVDLSSGDAANKAAAKDAGSTFGSMFGAIMAGINGIATAAAGIGGCVAGAKFKRAGGLQNFAAHSRT